MNDAPASANGNGVERASGADGSAMSTAAVEAPVPAPAAVRDEERVLERVLSSLKARTLKSTKRDYDTELVALRDQLAEARLEDAPPLIAQMERLQAVAARRAEVVEGVLDARNPYFAHMQLREGGKLRDVCLGRTTYLDPEHAVRVVDWRNAPVSRIYYRYREGDPYEESFGDKELEGEVVVRRDVTIASGKLLRVGASDGVHVRTRDGGWRTLAVRQTQLAGGQGTAVLPTENDRPRGQLGSGHGEDGLGRRDRYLPEIAALLDPKQFETISRPAAGVVVIQGGAGSGKTTIGLHRIAYLAFQAPKRFTPDKVIVVVPSRALATYTSRVLPALEVPHVTVVTMTEWQHDARVRALPSLPARVTDETPPAVIKVKKHPALLAALDARIDARIADADADLRRACRSIAPSIGKPIELAWDRLAASPLAGRLASLRRWLQRVLPLDGVPPPPSPSPERLIVDQVITRQLRRSRDLLAIWADLLTDRDAMLGLFDVPPVPGLAPLTRMDVEATHRWCTQRCEAVISALPANAEEVQRESATRRSERPRDDVSDREPKQASLFDRSEHGLGEDGEERSDDDEGPSNARRDDYAAKRASDYDEEDDREIVDAGRDRGIDGRAVDEEAELGPALDAEDDAILLRLHQRLRGALHGKGKSTLTYEHVFVDEVQDCASIDLALLVDCTTIVAGERSMTLAGDMAQRLTLDTGLGDFAPALERLGLPHVEVEPLTIGYRSTRQVLDLAREILGPLAPETPPIATRDGAPVELHAFGDAGAAAAFLAGTLRDLMMRESMASVALVTRFPWQADVYFDVLSRAEIPTLRRVAHQDFAFKPGIDLTDLKQVKGLEWDYVVLLDVNANVYGTDDESRHLLHIAATRAAHQLWLIATAEPSTLVKGWDQ